MKKLSLKPLSAAALAAGVALALVAGGFALGATPASAAGSVLGLTLTTLSGSPVTSNDGNTYTVEFDNPNETVTPPTGTVTITDGATGECQSAFDDWTLVGPDGGGGYDFTTSCHIYAIEEAGEVVTATYSGSDFGTLMSTNSLTIAPIPATLVLSGSAAASATGNDYTVLLTAENAAPPAGTVTITDSVGGGCQTDDWTNGGPTGSDDVNYTASCDIGTAESGGDTVTATYFGTDYTTASSNELTITESGATLTLIGSPGASATGNLYTAQMTTAVAIAPIGTVTITDSVGGGCQTSSWTSQGPFGVDNWSYTATCDIATAEYRTDAVSATYSGADYSTSLSNVLTVAAAASTLTLSGTPVTAVGNSYTATLDGQGGIAPDGEVSVYDSAGGSCTTSIKMFTGSDFHGGDYYTFTCDIPSAEYPGNTAYAVYSGSDYSPAQSNTLTVASAPATLTLSGTPVANEIGNSFVVTLDAPSALAPTGVATITDSANNSCQATDWVESSADGRGGEDFTATCDIENEELASDTVTAGYAGSDYTAPSSNVLTVSGPATISSASIEGVPVVGQQLFAVGSGVSGSPSPTPTYQWYDGSTEIPGATLSTYTVQSSDVGDSISVTITETNGVGAAASATSTPETVGAPATIATASITGTAEIGDALSAVAAGVSGTPAPTATYRWYDGSTEIAGAYLSTYTVQSSDGGYSISVTITETNGVGAPTSATSAGTADVPTQPSISTASISGTAEVGHTLTAVAVGVSGTPSPTPSYQWYQGSTEISGANSSTYTVQNADVGESISVTITETNGVGTAASATSTGTADVTAQPSIASASITGTPEVGDTLTAVASGVGGTPTPTPSYQWYDGSTEISGATSPTYTVQLTDLGSSISVTITETNGVGTAASATSSSLSTETPATVASASINGTPEVGDTLTAVASGVAGTPLPTATYQWYDGVTPILGATSATYTVQTTDLGDSLSVTITEANGVGSAASATSAGTATVITAPVSSGSGTSTPPITPPTTPPSTPPATPPTPPVTTTHASTPAPASLGFSPGTDSLSPNERTALDTTAKKLVSGARITITGYAKNNLALARRRADAVAAYLKARTHVTVTIRVSTAPSNKVTVVTTKN
jgi:outer membrane protein OmpA-like peptidoglycan-associated protein